MMRLLICIMILKLVFAQHICDDEYIDRAFYGPDGINLIRDKVIWSIDENLQIQKIRQLEPNDVTLQLYLQNGPNCYAIYNKRLCLEMIKVKDLLVQIVYRNTDNTEIYETFELIDEDNIKTRPINSHYQMPFNISSMGFTNETLLTFWPLQFITKDFRHRPGVFWPQRFTFIFIINFDKNASITSFHIEDYEKKRIINEIDDDKNVVYVGIFIWDQNPYVVVNPKSSNTKKISKIHKIKMSQGQAKVLKDFVTFRSFFKCTEETTTEKEKTTFRKVITDSSVSKIDFDNEFEIFLIIAIIAGIIVAVITAVCFAVFIYIKEKNKIQKSNENHFIKFKTNVFNEYDTESKTMSLDTIDTINSETGSKVKKF